MTLSVRKKSPKRSLAYKLTVLIFRGISRQNGGVFAARLTRFGLVVHWTRALPRLYRSGHSGFSHFSEDVKVTSTTSQEVGKGQGQRRGHPLYAPGLLASLNPGDSTSTTSDLLWKCNCGRSWAGEVGRHFTGLQAGLPGPRCWEMSVLPASGAAYPDTPRHPKMGGR